MGKSTRTDTQAGSVADVRSQPVEDMPEGIDVRLGRLRYEG